VHRYLLLAALLSLTACKKENPDYCAQSPTPSDCPAPDSPPGCTADEQCPGQVCDVPSRTCVQCTATSAAACTAATPVCDTDDHTCRACTAHSECASNACLPDGTCAAEDQVAYVTTNGQSTDCTHTAPCAEVSTALATNKPIIKVQSDPAKEAATIVIDGKAVTILAEPGAKLGLSTFGTILNVKSANADVSIVDLEITGAAGNGAFGIALDANGGVPQLTLTRVKIDENAGGGISATGGSLTVSQSTISGNQGGGISVTSGATFDISNNFIFRNGDPDSGTYGGISLDVATANGSTLEFNTIVDNRASAGTTRVGGVKCDITGFAAANNIIVRNSVGGSTSAGTAQTLGACTFPTSSVANDVSGLAFSSPDMEPYNYRLTAGSSAIDQATTPSNVAIDVDGDVRPQGAQKDQGADEYTP
jgi:hypothetical protein